MSLKKLSILVILASLLYSCSSFAPNDWVQFVPDETPFIIVPARNAALQSTFTSQYLPLLDDVSSSSIDLIEQIDSTAANTLQLKSILLYPGTDQKLQPVWITEAPSDFMENMKSAYKQAYGQQYYFFEEVPVLKIRTDQMIIFAAQVNDLLLISESSLGIENAIRAYRGEQPSAKLADVELKPGSLIMNVPGLDNWITQQTKVTYYPDLQNIFEGINPALLTIAHKDTTVGGGIVLSGKVPVTDTKSTLVEAISFKNAPLSLDEYISFDAAAFAFFRLPPVDQFPETLIDTTSVDSFFIRNKGQYQQIANTLNEELAVVFFTESGFRSVNEHAFIRKVKNPNQLRELLDELSNNDFLEKIEETYFARSFSLCQLIASKLCSFSNFYIKIVDEAVVIAPRRGLVEMIASDYRRRQVIIYEPFYQKMQTELPEQVSGLVIGGEKLFTFLKPFLKTNSYIGALTSRFDYISIAMKKDGSSLEFNLSTYNIESEQKPFIENWAFPVSAALSGPPIFSDVQGSADKEIIFATNAGKIFIVAADGSLIQTYSTANETPIGSPVTYDWYNTGQKIVMIAAGNKIYAWDETGDLLPNFPFVLDENITTPLTISDINNNGLADVIVATANRKLHALNARGNPLIGWPVQTNAVVESRPLVTQFRGRNAVFAFASNAVHAWSASGQSFAGFPRFIDAPFVGSPVNFNNEIIGAAADGSLYAFGEEESFDNSLSTSSSSFFSSDNVEILSVSGSSLAGTPSISEASNIAVMSSDGTVYLLNSNGALLFTESMGKTPARSWKPVITDINNDNSVDIIALADYGRIYAWNLETGERIQDLPTAAIKNVTIGDIDGDGLIEIVGQTEEGVTSWTIN